MSKLKWVNVLAAIVLLGAVVVRGFAPRRQAEHVSISAALGPVRSVYRSIGPHRGSRVTAVAGVTTAPFTFYMGAAGGGVWKTTDAGETWLNVSDGRIATGSIGAVAVAESAPSVVYVGTGSACIRGNVSPGSACSNRPMPGPRGGASGWRTLDKSAES